MTQPTIDLSHRGVDHGAWQDAVRAMHAFDVHGHDRLVVVAPHPDDETLGVGGLIAETSKRGAGVLVVVLSEGEAAGDDPLLAAIRHTELLRALDRLGVAAPVSVASWHLPDGRLGEHEDEITERLAALARPGDLVVAPMADDGHPDHEVAGRAVASLAGRPRTTDPAIRGVTWATFPVWAWHWHDPASSVITTAGRRVPLSDAAWRAKLDALQIYESQTTGDAPVLPAHFVRRFEQPFEVLVPAGQVPPPPSLGAVRS